MTTKTIDDVFKLCKDNNVQFVDFKFVDFPGVWQHVSQPIGELSKELFEEGKGFDGSSIRGWCDINNSDMLMFPDPTTAFIDPFCHHPTVSLTCNIVDPITREKYNLDPRNVAQKAAAYLKETGIGDVSYWGPEAEFFIFDDVRYESSVNGSFYMVDSDEGNWNTGRNSQPNLGYKPRPKGGYFPCPPTDSQQNLRAEMVLELMKAGIDIETQHHEVATGGQAEIDMRFTDLVKQADNLMLYKYIIRNVARRNGRTVTFMPKPLFGDNGSGMHVHISIWKNGKNMFAGNEYSGMSQEALWFIGGVIKHAKALNAITNPTTNSYKRLVPGYEAPVNLVYSGRNRSAAIRIPLYSNSPKAKRIEVRFPDPACNPYLAFAALLMAGVDGIQNKIDPGQPMDKNMYALPPKQLAKVKSVAGSLEQALDELEQDHKFLLEGNVFTEDVLLTWIDYKRVNEADPVRMRPHPHEFHLYYDI